MKVREVSTVRQVSKRVFLIVLDSMGIEYNILSPTQADVFARVNLSGLVNALAKEDCELIAAQERDESLESYYVNLVGGVRHD